MATTQPKLPLDLPNLRSMTPCPVCFDTYDSKKKRPQIICGNSHNVCTDCVKQLIKTSKQQNAVLKCPCCNVQIFADELDPPQINRSIISLLEDFEAAVQKRTSGWVACSDCNELCGERALRICYECAAKQGPDPRSTDFDFTKIDSLALCASCILDKHNSTGHTVVKYGTVRIIAEQRISSKEMCISTTALSAEMKMADSWLHCIDEKLLKCSKLHFGTYAEFREMKKEVMAQVTIADTVARKTEKMLKNARSHFEGVLKSMTEIAEKYASKAIDPICLDPMERALESPVVMSNGLEVFLPSSELILPMPGDSKPVTVKFDIVNDNAFEVSFKVKLRTKSGKLFKYGPCTGKIPANKSSVVHVTRMTNAAIDDAQTLVVLVSQTTGCDRSKELELPLRCPS